MKLVSVSDLAAAVHMKVLRGSQEAFSLVFSGPTSPTLASGIHPFTNRELGSFTMFVSPIAAPDSDQLYEALVISHSLSKGTKIPKPPKRKPARRKPRARRSVVRRITARRLRRGMAVKLRLSGKSHVKVVTAWLLRNDKVIATRVVKGVAGRHRVSLRLKTSRRLRNGRYDLIVRTRDRRGRVSYKRQGIRLR
jgi:hypothetical protein